MKKYKNILFTTILFILLLPVLPARPLQEAGYILEHEKDLAAEQPGPHNGGGSTTAFNFFSKSPGNKMVFRKRILNPGSSIGYHLQKEEEIYYILSGHGEMTMNGENFTVVTGDAILTKAGSSHSLKPSGKEGLTLIIAYLNK